MFRLKTTLSLKAKHSCGHAVAQLIETLRHKPEGYEFDSRQGHLLNPSGRTMALRSTQPLTEMSTRGVP